MSRRPCWQNSFSSLEFAGSSLACNIRAEKSLSLNVRNSFRRTSYPTRLLTFHFNAPCSALSKCSCFLPLYRCTFNIYTATRFPRSTFTPNSPLLIAGRRPELHSSIPHLQPLSSMLSVAVLDTFVPSFAERTMSNLTHILLSYLPAWPELSHSVNTPTA